MLSDKTVKALRTILRKDGEWDPRDNDPEKTGLLIREVSLINYPIEVSDVKSMMEGYDRMILTDNRNIHAFSRKGDAITEVSDFESEDVPDERDVYKEVADAIRVYKLQDRCYDHDISGSLVDALFLIKEGVDYSGFDEEAAKAAVSGILKSYGLPAYFDGFHWDIIRFTLDALKSIEGWDMDMAAEAIAYDSDSKPTYCYLMNPQAADLLAALVRDDSMLFFVDSMAIRALASKGMCNVAGRNTMNVLAIAALFGNTKVHPGRWVLDMDADLVMTLDTTARLGLREAMDDYMEQLSCLESLKPGCRGYIILPQSVMVSSVFEPVRRFIQERYGVTRIFHSLGSEHEHITYHPIDILEVTTDRCELTEVYELAKGVTVRDEGDLQTKGLKRSDMRMDPADWDVTKHLFGGRFTEGVQLKDVAELLRGQMIPKSEVMERIGLPMARGVRDGRLVTRDDKRVPGSKVRRKTQVGDIVLDLMSMEHYVMTEDDEDVVVSPTLLIIRPKEWDTERIAAQMDSDYFRDQLDALSGGRRFGTFKAKDLGMMRLREQ